MTQLFKNIPPKELLNKVLKTIGIDEFKSEYSFRRKDLIGFGTIEKMNEIKGELEQYYYPCKSKLYLSEINDRKCITIIRQFLHYFGYLLISKEKYDHGEKFVVYTLGDNNTVTTTKNVVLEFNK